MTRPNQFTREGGTVFLSYSRDDRDFMVQIEGLLEEFDMIPNTIWKASPRKKNGKSGSSK